MDKEEYLQQRPSVPPSDHHTLGLRQVRVLQKRGKINAGSTQTTSQERRAWIAVTQIACNIPACRLVVADSVPDAPLWMWSRLDTTSQPLTLKLKAGGQGIL